MVYEHKTDKIDPEELDPVELIAQSAAVAVKERAGLYAVGALGAAFLFGALVDLASD